LERAIGSGIYIACLRDFCSLCLDQTSKQICQSPFAKVDWTREAGISLEPQSQPLLSRLTPLVLLEGGISFISNLVGIDLCIKASILLDMDGQTPNPGIDSAPSYSRRLSFDSFADDIQRFLGIPANVSQVVAALLVDARDLSLIVSSDTFALDDIPYGHLTTSIHRECVLAIVEYQRSNETVSTFDDLSRLIAYRIGLDENLSFLKVSPGHITWIRRSSSLTLMAAQRGRSVSRQAASAVSHG
jgi:hypothetical protein